MTYSIAAPLLDAFTAVVCRRNPMDIGSPGCAGGNRHFRIHAVSRTSPLQKDGCLETYDRETGGRTALLPCHPQGQPSTKGVY